MHRRARALAAAVLTLAAAALTACTTNHPPTPPGHDSTPGPAAAAYTAGWKAGSNAMAIGKTTPVLAGDPYDAMRQCEHDIVYAIYNAGSLPPGFTTAHKEPWYTGCEDALQGLTMNTARANTTLPPEGDHLIATPLD